MILDNLIVHNHFLTLLSEQIPRGLGIATGIKVGQHLGGSRSLEAKAVAKVSSVLSSKL